VHKAASRHLQRAASTLIRSFPMIAPKAVRSRLNQVASVALGQEQDRDFAVESPEYAAAQYHSQQIGIEISGKCSASFRAPLPRGFLAAWAGKPQVLSHAAATTCRVKIVAWKARRESPKVARNGSFPAKFQRLYTSLTWRFLGWSSRDIVCCELLQGSR
jgi:hypothetical protein